MRNSSERSGNNDNDGDAQFVGQTQRGLPNSSTSISDSQNSGNSWRSRAQGAGNIFDENPMQTEVNNEPTRGMETNPSGTQRRARRRRSLSAPLGVYVLGFFGNSSDSEDSSVCSEVSCHSDDSDVDIDQDRVPRTNVPVRLQDFLDHFSTPISSDRCQGGVDNTVAPVRLSPMASNTSRSLDQENPSGNLSNSAQRTPRF